MSEQDPFSIYLHWPFCSSKCPYCNFNSHVRPHVEEERWVTATLRALDHWTGDTAGRTVQSVFWGGGTPSLMQPRSVERVLAHIAKRWPLAADCEITLEANPTTHEAERFAGFRAAGVNRLSLGVQSFRQQALDFLGRTYRVAEAERALAHIAATFPRYSFDLIYALPDQNPDAWEGELHHALDFADRHLSLYQLTFERGTQFFQAMQTGRIRSLDDDTAADLYDMTVAALAERGLELYEISNFAAPGEECRHNLIYWQGGEWIGVGPGAHGRLGRVPIRRALNDMRSPEKWLTAVEVQGHGVENDTMLDRRETAEELVLTGLRLAQGIDRAAFARVAGQPLADVLSTAKLAEMVSHGLAVDEPDRIALTPAGQRLLDSAVAFLLAGPAYTTC